MQSPGRAGGLGGRCIDRCPAAQVDVTQHSGQIQRPGSVVHRPALFADVVTGSNRCIAHFRGAAQKADTGRDVSFSRMTDKTVVNTEHREAPPEGQQQRRIKNAAIDRLSVWGVQASDRFPPENRTGFHRRGLIPAARCCAPFCARGSRARSPSVAQPLGPHFLQDGGSDFFNRLGGGRQPADAGAAHHGLGFAHFHAAVLQAGVA